MLFNNYHVKNRLIAAQAFANQKNRSDEPRRNPRTSAKAKFPRYYSITEYSAMSLFKDLKNFVWMINIIGNNSDYNPSGKTKENQYKEKPPTGETRLLSC